MELPVFRLTINKDKESGVTAIALVDLPAIERDFQVFKNIQYFKVEDEDQRIVSGAMMVADMPIFRSDPQRGNHFVVFDKETIAAIQEKWVKQGNATKVNLMHDPNQPAEGVFVMSQFLIDSKRGINTPNGHEELTDGSWFGEMKINNQEIFQQIKDGNFAGFSVEGFFDQELMQPDKEMLDNMLNQLEDIFTKSPKMFEKIKEKLATLKGEEVQADEPKKDEPKKDEPVKFVASTLEDGTVINAEPDLAEGATVTVEDPEAGAVPLGDGTWVLEDGQSIVVAEGVITEVIAPVEEELEAEITPKMTEAIEREAKSIIEKKITEIEKKFTEELESYKADLATEKERFNSLVEIVESIAKEDSEAPAEKPKNTFKQKRLEAAVKGKQTQLSRMAVIAKLRNTNN